MRRSQHARDHKDQEAARKAGRHARVRSAEHKVIPARDVARLRDRWGRRCACCREPIPSTQGLDHKEPYVREGRNAIGNLLPLCTACNSQKGRMFLSEWRKWRVERDLPVWPVGFRAAPRWALP